MGKRWTPTDIEAFTHLWNEGVSMQDCAKQLGRTFMGLEKARRKFGLLPREGMTTGRPKSKHGSPPSISKNGPIVGEFDKAMQRETDFQSMKFAKLIAAALRA